MAANFEYKREYVDSNRDMDDLYAHMKYLQDNPPIGGLYKTYLKARYGGKSKQPSKRYSNNKEGGKQMIHDLCTDLGINLTHLEKKPKRKIIKL